MEVAEVDTNKGHRSIICEGYRYRLDNILKSDAVSWRCTMKGCKARLRTDTSAKTVLQRKMNSVKNLMKERMSDMW